MMFFCSLSQAQQKAILAEPMASVFFIGENEAKYEKIVQSYNEMLFTVCNNNMQMAFDHWSSLLKDIEDYSLKSNYDLKGVKMWMNVFWNNNGTIDYIVFYPKPNSKNLNYDKLKPILAQFISTYQSPFKHTSKFSHYGSAAFPVFGKSISGTEK
jgi:hypothetical protein